MVVNPRQRWSASKLLKHPWLEECASNYGLNEEQEKQIVNNITHFSRATRLEKDLISLLSGLITTSDDINELRIQFNELDRNNDGSIDISEI